MKYFVILCFAFANLLLTVDASGQISKDDQKKIKRALKEAGAFYEDEYYLDAVNSYKNAVSLGATLSLDETKRLARCYYYLNDVDNAWETYSAIENNLTGEDIFNYARMLQQVSLYDDAITWFNRSKSEGANTFRVNDFIEQCKWASNNTRRDQSIITKPCIELLAATQSFGIQFFGDKVVYSSAVEGAKTNKNGNEFLNLFCSDVKDGNVVEGTGRLFSQNLRSPYDVGAICFTSDGKYMYYTKAVIVDETDRFKIFVVEYDGKDWINETELSINGDDYDCAYPALSLDNNTLYFVSNKEGGYGGKDIYCCERKGPNSFGKVKNLGKSINTYEDEVYPVINRDGKLYFSSRGHNGFGGLDIFSAEFIDGKWQNVQNMMQPINTNRDDFSYVMDPTIDGFAFISSNAISGGYSDKIFTVRPKSDSEEPSSSSDMFVFGEDMAPMMEDMAPPMEMAPPVEPEVPQVKVPDPYTFKTTVISTYNGTKIDGALVTISDAASGKFIASATTDANGKLVLVIPGESVSSDKDYNVVVMKDGYNEKSLVATIAELESLGKEGISLTPIFNDAVLDDISGMSIPYGEDLDASALETLDKLAAYLMQNPNIVVKLNGHTEAKGNRYGNLNISQKMSDKAKDYLVSKGVNEDQLIPRGYGERYLKNRCHRGVYCDRAQHMDNRRIEVVVWNVRK